MTVIPCTNYAPNARIDRPRTLIGPAATNPAAVEIAHRCHARTSVDADPAQLSGLAAWLAGCADLHRPLLARNGLTYAEAAAATHGGNVDALRRAYGPDMDRPHQVDWLAPKWNGRCSPEDYFKRMADAMQRAGCVWVCEPDTGRRWAADE